MHTQIHKTHHILNLRGEAITFPLIVFFVINHGGYIQMSFCPRTPNILMGHNLLCRPPIEMKSEAKL
jgi:hypothetical protein